MQEWVEDLKMSRLLVWSISDLVECIEKMIQNKFDCVMFITGRRGLGKSTLAYKVATRLKNVPQPFEPERDLVYSREATLKHLANKKGGVIVSDEMINVAYNRDFYFNEQKQLLKMLNMYRDSCNIFIGAVPKFRDLDIQIQRLCKIRIDVVARGVGIIHLQLNTTYLLDGWDSRNNEKIESKWALKGRNPKYAQLSTARGIIRFNDLTPLQRETYEKIKESRRGQVFQDYAETTMTGDPKKKFYDNLLEGIKNGKIAMKDLEMIGKVNEIKPQEIRRKINLMLADSGEEKRLKDYLHKKKDRTDSLGFRLPEAPQEEAVNEDEGFENVFDFNEDSAQEGGKD